MGKREKEKEDAQLFFEAVKDVQPLRHKVADLRPRRSSAPAHALDRPSRGSYSFQTDTVVEDSFLRNGVQTAVLRNFGRGQIPIEGELDLHGYSASEAEAHVRAFLAGARVANRQRGVRIIHGKRYGSPDRKSVLREKTRQWLRETEAVLAFCSAEPAQGGTGAVHILLKKK